VGNARRTIAVDRGSQAVKSALINAARAMLAEVGPSAMSVRTVANRAGVNHGQVHHYFGGKQGLVEAAMHSLAQEHFDLAHARSRGKPVPEPLTLGEDWQYLRAIVHSVLDGDLATATREIEQGISIADESRRYLTQKFDRDGVPVDVKARIAITCAMELGWAALEPYILQIADVREDEVDEVRDRARVLSRRFVEEIIAENDLS